MTWAGAYVCVYVEYEGCMYVFGVFCLWCGYVCVLCCVCVVYMVCLLRVCGLYGVGRCRCSVGGAYVCGEGVSVCLCFCVLGKADSQERKVL